jgi:hypothetical protein
MSRLLSDQDDLDRYLQRLVDEGRPLRGLLVLEDAAEPEPSGIWRRYETHRIGKNNSVWHQYLSDNWVNKDYGQHLTSDALQLEERAAMIANAMPESVRRAFDIGGIEWGRADHATFRGQDIIYEINTALYA